MSVGVGVWAVISLMTIVVVVVITIAIASVIARMQKAKNCGIVDLKETVSLDKYSMQILVYCTVNFYAAGTGLL